VAFALSNIKRQKEGKESFDEGVSVNIFISKNCWNKYARNLLPAKPAERL